MCRKIEPKNLTSPAKGGQYTRLTINVDLPVSLFFRNDKHSKYVLYPIASSTWIAVLFLQGTQQYQVIWPEDWFMITGTNFFKSIITVWRAGLSLTLANLCGWFLLDGQETHGSVGSKDKIRICRSHCEPVETSSSSRFELCGTNHILFRKAAR